MSQAHCQLFRAFYFDNITPLMQASVGGNVDLMDTQKTCMQSSRHDRNGEKNRQMISEGYSERKRDGFLQHDTQPPTYNL